MHSALVRAQNVFGFFTTIAFAVAALIAASDLIAARTPSAVITVDKVQVEVLAVAYEANGDVQCDSIRGRPNYYSTKEEQYANIRFSLDADLSSLFTWNTKQVFVYVTAVWPSANLPHGSGDLEAGMSQEMNEAVIWDTIITSPSSDHLSNLAPVARKKLIKSGKGKSIDPSRGVLKLKNQKPKYQITSPTSKLAETTDVKLYVHYNVQPWVGVLTWTPQIKFGTWKLMKGGVSKLFNLPALKKKSEGTQNASRS